VLFSFEVLYDEKLHPPMQEMLESEGKNFTLTAPDPYTVVINTGKPHAGLLDALCPGNLPIIPKHVLQESYKSGTFAAAYNVSTPPEKLVTSGGWRLSQHVTNEKTVLVRNPYYFGFDQNKQRLPYLDELVILVVPDQDAADLKFRAGGVDAVDDVKPENYKWYEENQQKGNFTLHDIGPDLNTNFFWFNLNTVKKAGGGKKVGDPVISAVKYDWFKHPQFRRAVSMAIDRQAMIPSVFFGEGHKNWAIATPANKVWHSPDLVRYDYNPGEAKKLLAGLGFKDGNGDGVLEDPRGNPISFTLKTNSDNTLRVALGNFVKDDLAKVGIKVALTPVEFNTLITNIRADFQYDAILLGLQSGIPPDPGMMQNVYRSSGITHFWNMAQPKPETAEEARIDALMDEIVTVLDPAARKRAYKEVESIVNEQGWFIWLPIANQKLPVSNRYGNVQPSILSHRILWNVETVYVK
jgi:peptide/nickel transport system substrate-binding protein